MQAPAGPSACSASFGMERRIGCGHCAKAAPSSAPLSCAQLCGAPGPAGTCAGTTGTPRVPGTSAAVKIPETSSAFPFRLEQQGGAEENRASPPALHPSFNPPPAAHLRGGAETRAQPRLAPHPSALLQGCSCCFSAHKESLLEALVSLLPQPFEACLPFLLLAPDKLQHSVCLLAGHVVRH